MVPIIWIRTTTDRLESQSVLAEYLILPKSHLEEWAILSQASQGFAEDAKRISKHGDRKEARMNSEARKISQARTPLNRRKKETQRKSDGHPRIIPDPIEFARMGEDLLRELFGHLFIYYPFKWETEKETATHSLASETWKLATFLIQPWMASKCGKDRRRWGFFPLQIGTSSTPPTVFLFPFVAPLNRTDTIRPSRNRNIQQIEERINFAAFPKQH